MENENEDVDDKTDFKQNLTGYVYQLKLLLLFLWRGFKSENCTKFLLGTELKEAEKFDDVIFFYDKSEETFVRYMQAKYSRFINSLEYKDFQTQWNGGRCNLKNYFISYRKLKQRIYQKEINDLIICTNIPFGNSLVLKKNASNYLTFKDVSNILTDEIFSDMRRYQLEDITTANVINEELKLCTNLNLLAKELTPCIFKSQKLDLQDYWISAYFNVLIKEEVIEEKNYYVCSAANANPLENKEIQEFNKYFVEKRLSLDGITNENVRFDKTFIDNLRNQNGHDLATLEETAEVLVQHVVNKIDYSHVAINLFPTKTFKKLNTVVKYEQSWGFTNKFINDISLSPNAKNFRKKFLDECEKEAAKNLDVHQIFAKNAINGIKKFDSTPTLITDEEAIAKCLVEYIFYQKELHHIFETKYSILKEVFDLDGMNSLKFKKEFLKNANHGRFRETFLAQFTKEKLKTTTITFKQDMSKFSIVVEQLKKSFDAPETEVSKILKLDYNTLKKNKTEGLLEALNGSVFVATNERDKIGFTNANQLISNKVAEKFMKILKHKFKANFEQLNEFKVEYINYPPCFQELEEDAVDIVNDIKTFCEKLFIINTPNENDLLSIIGADMGDKFNLLNADMLTYDLFQEVLEWAKEKEDKFLSKNDANFFMTNIEQKLSKKMELGCSLEYMNKLNEYKITFDDTLEDLINFITSDVRILHLQTDDILLTTIKVHQTLTIFGYFDKKDVVIFGSLTSLLRMENNNQKHVSNAFRSKTADLLIIVDKEVQNDNVREFCCTLGEILNERNKQIVVISNEGSHLMSILKILRSDDINVIQHKIKFAELTLESQLLIRKQTKINFQGNIVPMNELLNEEECTELIDSSTLKEMIYGNIIVVGKQVQMFTKAENEYYRPRKIRLIEVETKIFNEKSLPNNHLFAIEGMRSKTINDDIQHLITKANDFILKGAKDDKRFVILEEFKADRQFREICKKKLHSCIHWLKMSGKKLIWFRSRIPPSSTTGIQEIEKYVSQKEEYVSEEFLKKHVEQNRVVIFADTPGMGKSTVLTSFTRKLQDKKQWIIRINLNHYITTLDKIKQGILSNKLRLNFETFDSDFGKLIMDSFLTHEIYQNNSLNFEHKMFNHFFTKRGILYIFDGFDEINPDYGDIVLKIIQKLMENEKNRIWIASRTSFKNILQDTFNTFAYDLKPFDRKDQEEFLKYYWSSNYLKLKGREMPNQNRLRLYINKLLNATSKKLGHIIGIPLQTKMLAEIFQENSDTQIIPGISCFQFVEDNKVLDKVLVYDESTNSEEDDSSEEDKEDNSDEYDSENDEINFTSMLNFFVVYEKFFENKIIKYYLYEKGGVDPKIPSAKVYINRILTDENYIHKIFGCLALIEKNDHKVLTKDEKQNMKQWINDFNAHNKNMGIVDSFNEDGIPTFFHFTYAEYFAACYLVDKLCHDTSSYEQILEVVNDIANKDVPVFVQCIHQKLNQEFSKETVEIYGEKLLIISVENSLLNCINILLNNKIFNSALSDITLSWRNALYSAAKKGHFDVVLFILLKIYEKGETFDRFFGIYQLYCFINFNDGIKKFNCKAGIKNLFDEIISAAKQNVQPNSNKKLHFVDILFLEDDGNLNYADAVAVANDKTVANFFNFFSFNSIVNILQESKFFENFFYSAEFSNIICLRHDVNDEEKTQLFESIISNIVEKSEKESVTKKILFSIIQCGCGNLLKNLLQSKTLDFIDQMFFRCFEIACKCDNLHIIKTLLPYLQKIKDGSIIEERKWSYSYSPLLYTLRYKTKFETVKYVYETTKSLEKKLINNTDLLAIAVTYCQNIKIVDFLIEKGPYLGIDLTESYKVWYYYALGRGYDDIINYFEQKFDCLEVRDICGSRNSIESLDEKQDEDGNTLLHIAAQNNDFKQFRNCLVKGDCYNIKNNNGETPENMMENNSSVKKLFEIIDELFNNAEKNDFTFPNFIGGMSVTSFRHANGKTLLHYAIEKRNLKVFQFLFTEWLFCFKNVEKAVKIKEYKSLLNLSVKNNNIEIIKHILKSEITVNVEAEDEDDDVINEDEDGDKLIKFSTILSVLNDIEEIKENECKILLLHIKNCLIHVYNEDNKNLKNELQLIKNNDDFNIITRFETKDRRSVFQYACKDYEIAPFLLENGFVVHRIKNMQNLKINQLFLMWFNFADYILSIYIDPESIIKYYNNQYTKKLSFLGIKKDAADKIIVNVRFNRDMSIFSHFSTNVDGGTLLHVAAIARNVKIVEWLINEKNADPLCKDHNNINIYDIAERSDFQKMLFVLPPRKKEE